MTKLTILHKDDRVLLVYVPEPIKRKILGQRSGNIHTITDLYKGYYLRIPTNYEWYQVSLTGGQLLKMSGKNKRVLKRLLEEIDVETKTSN